ncbi:hypothetical protein G5714_004261 [Onychostoma macrolepis]|uniref:Uncharacterized protein n=1 Tax=Onychostoma macrolepis TaxID=369639 RepID=A0A7J6D495_9TELE|nr:hypothetical protein G5714_004261 [Onychostoma macrolepis]
MADKFQTEHNLQAAVVCLDKSESVAHNSLSVSHSVHDEKANPLETESTASKMSLYEEGEEGDVVYYQNQRAASPKPSCVSMKSEQSMGAPIYFSDEAVTFNPRDDQTGDLAFQQPLRAGPGHVTSPPRRRACSIHDVTDSEYANELSSVGFSEQRPKRLQTQSNTVYR